MHANFMWLDVTVLHEKFYSGFNGTLSIANLYQKQWNNWDFLFGQCCLNIPVAPPSLTQYSSLQVSDRLHAVTQIINHCFDISLIESGIYYIVSRN